MPRPSHPSSGLHHRLLRTLLALFCAGIVLHVFASLSYATPSAIGQVFPYTGNGTTDWFAYQDAYINTPNPPLGANQWVATPNAVTNWTGIFIESGAWKTCNGSGNCALHPYSSWQSATGSGFLELTDVNLAAGGLYQYKSYSYNVNNWTAVFCSGTGCRGILNANLGVGTLPYAASGGESSDVSVRMGTITTSYNRALKNGSYQDWCYTKVKNNVGGQVSGCNAATHAWSVTYN